MRKSSSHGAAGATGGASVKRSGSRRPSPQAALTAALRTVRGMHTLFAAPRTRCICARALTYAQLCQESRPLHDLEHLGQSFRSSGGYSTPRRGAQGPASPIPFDLEASMYGSELLGNEVGWHVAKHKRQLAAATKTIEEISARRIEEQAMVAAEAAGAAVTERLVQRADELKLREQQLQHQHRKAYHQIEEFKQQQDAMLAYERAEMQRMLDDERAAIEQNRQDMMKDLKLLAQHSEAELKHEWLRVNLTNEVARVFLSQTAEAAAAQKAAVDAKAAADSQMGLAMDMQQKLITESKAQAGQREQENKERGASSERLAQLEGEVVELRTEIARLRGVAEDAERRALLAERALGMQSVLAQSTASSVRQEGGDEVPEQADQELVALKMEQQAQAQAQSEHEQAQAERSLRDTLERDVRALERELAESDDSADSDQPPDTGSSRVNPSSPEGDPFAALEEFASLMLPPLPVKEPGPETAEETAPVVEPNAAEAAAQKTEEEATAAMQAAEAAAAAKQAEEEAAAKQAAEEAQATKQAAEEEVAAKKAEEEAEAAEQAAEAQVAAMQAGKAVAHRAAEEAAATHAAEEAAAAKQAEQEEAAVQDAAEPEPEPKPEPAPNATLRTLEAAFAEPPSAAMLTDYSMLMAEAPEGIPPQPEPLDPEA